MSKKNKKSKQYAQVNAAQVVQASPASVSVAVDLLWKPLPKGYTQDNRLLAEVWECGT